MANRQGTSTYTIVVTATAADAERTLAALGATAEATGAQLSVIERPAAAAGKAVDEAAVTAQAAGDALSHAGEKASDAHDGFTKASGGATAAERALDRAESRAASLGRTIETSLLNGNVSGLNSALAGVATQGGPAGIALGTLAVATVLLTSALKGSADSFADSALAAEKDAIAHNRLTPEITKAAAEAQAWKDVQAGLSDELSKTGNEIGGHLAPYLTALLQQIDNLVGKTNEAGQSQSFFGEAIDNNLKVMFPWLASQAEDIQKQALVKQIMAERAAEQDKLSEKVKAAAEHEEHLAHAARETALAEQAAAETLAQDSLSAARAKLNITELQIAWDQKLAAAEKQKADDIAAAEDAIRQAAENTAHVRQQAADNVAAAQDRLAAAQQRLRDDSKADVRDARTVADAQQRLARVQQDIAEGKYKGEDATRAYQDAEQALERAQQDQASNEQDRAKQRDQDARDVADAKKKLAETEQQAADDVRKAEDEQRKATERLRQAQHEAGVTALERRQHELEMRQAVLDEAKAQQQLKGDLDEFGKKLASGEWSKTAFEGYLKRLHVEVFPEILDDLDKIQQRLNQIFYGPGSSYAPGGSTYNQQVPAGAQAAAGQRSVVQETHVHIHGMVVGRDTAQQVADVVHTELIRRQNGGTDLGFKGTG